MAKNRSEKILKIITAFLILASMLFSLSMPARNSIYLFLLVFALLCWQRERLENFEKRFITPKNIPLITILTGWFWAIFLEFNSGRLPFHQRIGANLLIGAGYYLPYFAVWLKLIKRFRFSFFEVFYLSGLGRLLFDAVVTRQLFSPILIYAGTPMVLFAILARLAATVAIFGSLTTLPYLDLTTHPETSHEKPLKEYLLALLPGFLALASLVAWIGVLKIVFGLFGQPS